MDGLLGSCHPAVIHNPVFNRIGFDNFKLLLQSSGDVVPGSCKVIGHPILTASPTIVFLLAKSLTSGKMYVVNEKSF